MKKRVGIDRSLFHTISSQDSLKSLNSSLKGLSSHEATTRLHQYGLNEVARHTSINPLKILLEQFASPLVWILALALIVSIVLGEKVDAIVIAIIVIANAILGFVQEFRAERSIEALQSMATPKAKVIRDGREIVIDSKKVVPGDILVLESGDKVPADARLLEIHSFYTQEGPLTGESQPVTKSIAALSSKTSLADRKNMVYASTIVSKGRAKAVVCSTGMKTEVGKIAHLIQESHEKYTPLQKKLKQLGKILTIAVIVVAIVVFGAGLFSGKAASVMFLTAIALAVAAIPEGLPAVITISLALGVQRMIKRNALVRKLPSIETLGSVDVICTDKTGTLTHNEMTVTKVWMNGIEYDVTGSGYSPKGMFTIDKKVVDSKPLDLLLKIGMLCNDVEFEGVKKRKVIGDPTEAALIVSAEKSGFKREEALKKEPRVDEVTFSSERKMMTTIHKTSSGKVSYTKGAPDVVLEKCDRILINGQVKKLNRATRKKILEKNDEFANKALRVLGFAYNKETKNPEKDMIFVGFQAMLDPPRSEVKGSIKKCHEAGIRVVMITGDQIATARAIGEEIGITGRAVSGHDLDSIKDLEKEVDNIGIFARVSPEHKLRIVKALKSKGHTVAMTGDGVNDAPALKKADIGVSMGITGTDVAKEAADMILTDDNFTSIVNAVEEGRGIFDNIRKFVSYLLSSNLGEIIVIFFASIFGMPLPLTALQILWVNLVTDGLPATALGFDPASPGIMKKKPRESKESIISKGVRNNILIMGGVIGVATLVLFMLYLDSGLAKAQTIAFTSLVVFEIVRLYLIRSKYRLSMFSNKWLVGAVGLSVLLHVGLLYTPLGNVFGVVALELIDWLIIGAGALVMMGITKIVRVIQRSVSGSKQ